MIGRRLKDCRLSVGISADDVDKALKFPAGTTAHIEANAALADQEKIVRIVDYLGCTLEWIIRGRGEPALAPRVDEAFPPPRTQSLRIAP